MIPLREQPKELQVVFYYLLGEDQGSFLGSGVLAFFVSIFMPILRSPRFWKSNNDT
jgi:hypothetical protein